MTRDSLRRSELDALMAAVQMGQERQESCHQCTRTMRGAGANSAERYSRLTGGPGIVPQNLGYAYKAFAFLSPAAISAFSPHQKHDLGRVSVINYQSRRAFDASSISSPATNIPTACPTCRSSSITTTAKSPSSDSYWRCARCGEIWNESRYHATTFRSCTALTQR